MSRTTSGVSCRSSHDVPSNGLELALALPAALALPLVGMLSVGSLGAGSRHAGSYAGGRSNGPASCAWAMSRGVWVDEELVVGFGAVIGLGVGAMSK